MRFTPHFHLAKEQREITRVLASRALVVDGLPYSPGMPEHLRTSPAPIMFATRAQHHALTDPTGHRLGRIGPSACQHPVP